MESLDKSGIVIDNWIKDAPEEFVLSYSNKFNKAELMLGYQKYLLLKQNGYFLKPNIENKITGRLTSDLVKQTLANTSSVVFEVTEKCNLACDYCCYSNIYGNYSERKFENLPLA